MEERTLSDIICDNTVIEKVQERALESPHPTSNPIRKCHGGGGAAPPPPAAPAAAPAAPAVPSVVPETTTLQVVETTQNPVLQRVPKSLPLHPDFTSFNFESLRPRHSKAFHGHHSIFEAFRKLQTQEFHRITNTSRIIKPVKFLERFDHSDAIILNPWYEDRLYYRLFKMIQLSWRKTLILVKYSIQQSEWSACCLLEHFKRCSIETIFCIKNQAAMQVQGWKIFIFTVVALQFLFLRNKARDYEVPSAVYI